MALMSSRLYRYLKKSSGARNSHAIPAVVGLLRKYTSDSLVMERKTTIRITPAQVPLQKD